MYPISAAALSEHMQQIKSVDEEGKKLANLCNHVAEPKKGFPEKMQYPVSCGSLCRVSTPVPVKRLQTRLRDKFAQVFPQSRSSGVYLAAEVTTPRGRKTIFAVMFSGKSKPGVHPDLGLANSQSPNSQSQSSKIQISKIAKFLTSRIPKSPQNLYLPYIILILL